MLRHKVQSEQGAATVEFAVVVVLLLLLLFGIMEFGLTFFQKHYVSHVAREGLRVGVVANNYNCFDGTPSDDCTTSTDRWNAVDLKVRDGLDIFYSDATVDIQSPQSDNDEADRKPLIVSISVENFMPSLISGFIPGYTRPENISFTVTGDYEDPQEP
jgi:hypothetical protein